MYKMPKPLVKERRRFIRHPMCFPLTYSILERKRTIVSEEPSTTINIGRGGLLFSAKQSVDKNSLIRIKIPFQDKIFKIEAKVMHCNKSEDTKLFHIGVSFHRLNDAFKIKLIEQLYLISEYRDLRSIQLGKEISLEDASREWIKRYSERFKRLYW